jgi:lipopolysaccharide biosynthesis protein
MSKISAIAIHLPQFHPFTENDTWWGKGFTEWTNVTQSKPLFKNHYQPHLPADLGFYDLRLEETRIAQANLAQSYGIDGFCYYHYWFNQKRLLNRPLDDMLKTQIPDFPFMLCWANENWTRRWDGKESDVLIKQEYNLKDDEQHINFLCENFFQDKRYIKVNQKPFFIVYRPNLFPNIQQTTDIWRERAIKLGIGELYLGYMQSFGQDFTPQSKGFDVAVEFPPHSLGVSRIKPPLFERVLHKLGIKKSPFYENDIFDYAQYVMKRTQKELPEYPFYPTIMPMWDNTARKKSGKNAAIYLNSTPELYAKVLEYVCQQTQQKNKENAFVFINAWNEWAEGNHLEPCQKWGLKYLEKTKEIITKYHK